MTDMDQFFTREAANGGTKLELTTPDGKPTEHWLTILGTDSDAYHRANASARRRVSMVEIEAKAIEDTEKREEFLYEAQRKEELKILSALLADWSFEKEPTEANKIEFLSNAPQIAEQINRLSVNRRLFIKTESKS